MIKRPRAIVKGRSGQVWLYETHISIKRRGFTGFMLFGGGRGTKDIRIQSITAIQIKKPGLLAGYIQFVFSGGKESRRGVFDATKDEDSVLIGNLRQYRQFVNLRDAIHQIQSVPDSRSDVGHDVLKSGVLSGYVAEEIVKLANLRNDGIISDKEFQNQKRKLLD